MFQVRYLLAGGNRQTDFQIAAMISNPAPDRAAPGSMANNAFSKRANARAFMAERRKLYPNDNYYIVDLRSEKVKRTYAEGELSFVVQSRVKYKSGIDSTWMTDAPGSKFKTRAEARAYLKSQKDEMGPTSIHSWRFRIVKVVTTA